MLGVWMVDGAVVFDCTLLPIVSFVLHCNCILAFVGSVFVVVVVSVSFVGKMSYIALAPLVVSVDMRLEMERGHFLA